MYTLKYSPFRAVWPFTNLPMAMKINCSANYAKKKSKGKSKIYIYRILNLCLRPSGIALPWDSDLPLFSLCWYFIHLPLWLPCWHMNAAFNFFLSLCMEVYAAFWTRNFHNCSSSNRNTTQSCLLNAQCGQAPSAPRSSMEGEGNRGALRSIFEHLRLTCVPVVACAQSLGLHGLQKWIPLTTNVPNTYILQSVCSWSDTSCHLNSKYLPIGLNLEKKKKKPQKVIPSFLLRWGKQNQSFTSGDWRAGSTDPSWRAADVMYVVHMSFHLTEQYIKADWPAEVTNRKLN